MAVVPTFFADISSHIVLAKFIGRKSIRGIHTNAALLRRLLSALFDSAVRGEKAELMKSFNFLENS